MLGVAGKSKDKARGKHFFLYHFVSARVSAELDHRRFHFASSCGGFGGYQQSGLCRSQAKSAGLIQFTCGLNGPL